MLILSPPAASSARAVGFLLLNESLSVFPHTLFIHFCSSLLSSPSPRWSQIASPHPFSSAICCSISRLKLQGRLGRQISWRLSVAKVWRQRLPPSGSDGEMKKEHVNCGEKSRNFVVLLLLSAPRDDGGTFDVWCFHSFLCFPLVSSLLWLFHILFSLVCAIILFFFIPFFHLSFWIRQGRKKLYFQKSELGSSSFRLCWTIKSELSSSLNCPYSNLLWSPFLHLQ